MADIVKKAQEKIILAEIQAGVDPLTSASVGDLNEYVLDNEDGDIALTHFRGTVTRVLAIDGSDDYSPSGIGGATSLSLQVVAGDIVPL